MKNFMTVVATVVVIGVLGWAALSFGMIKAQVPYSYQTQTQIDQDTLMIKTHHAALDVNSFVANVNNR